MPSVSVFAVGKRGYTYGAANLSASIAHYAPDVKVNLYTDGVNLRYLKPEHIASFASIVALNEADYTTEGRLDPGKLKCRIADLITEKETVYIDADSIAVKDIRPFLRALKADGRDYICECIDTYLPWASEAKVKAKVGNPKAYIPPVQTSWAFIRKSGFFETVRRVSDAGYWSLSELDHKWGKSLPDELVYTTACAMEGRNPSWRNEMLFGNKIVAKNIAEVREQFSFMTLYGNGAGRPHVRGIYIDMYDRVLHDVFKAKLMNHSFKSNYILTDKYLN